MATTSGATWLPVEAMTFAGSRRLVGLGFGPIQAGLFVYEAQGTGSYGPPVVIDVRADLVASLRAAGGRFALNIAHADHVEVAQIGPLQVLDSTDAAQRPGVVEAIAAADELATALPSVAFYESGAPWSPHLLLAEALRRRAATQPPLIVFCAENHRAAARLLQDAVRDALPRAEVALVASRARFVDTVIGKMSGVIDDPAEIASHGLATITPDLPQAFLVESFDRILISRVDPEGGVGAPQPGIPVLREVDDLAPFEAAKLLGHNATHALAGFIGTLLGVDRVADLQAVPGAMAFLRRAFVDESGRTLRGRFEGSDPLFTADGYAAFADDLLERMVNPHLADTVERAARDPRRKLGWDDRLVGLMRLALADGIPTPRYAMGVAAGLEILGRDDVLAAADPIERLRACWPRDLDGRQADAVVVSVGVGMEWLDRWRADGFAALTAAGPEAT
jgi:mannitol-1-phosphate 5-dehydrogenase